MNLYNRYETSKEAEENGIDLIFGDGIRITVRRIHSGNKKFANRAKIFNKKYGRQLENGNLSDDIQRQFIAETYAKAVVVDWKGVTDKEGKKLEFNEKNCIKILVDLPDLMEEIADYASSFENFRQANLDENVKN